MIKLKNIFKESQKEVIEKLTYGNSITFSDEEILNKTYNNSSELQKLGSLEYFIKFIKYYTNIILKDSKVKQIVYRQGEIKLTPKSGGIWFGESEQDVIAFTKTIWRDIKEENYIINPCYIELKNPYIFDSFWGDYIPQTEELMFGNMFERFNLHELGGPSTMFNKNPRQTLMNNLKEKGHDGFIVEEDTWNDSGDEQSVTSKQFAIFNPEQAFCLNNTKFLIHLFKNYMSNFKDNDFIYNQE